MQALGAKLPIIEEIFDAVVVALRRDPRFAGIPLNEFELLFADIHPMQSGVCSMNCATPFTSTVSTPWMELGHERRASSTQRLRR